MQKTEKEFHSHQQLKNLKYSQAILQRFGFIHWYHLLYTYSCHFSQKTIPLRGQYHEIFYQFFFYKDMN